MGGLMYVFTPQPKSKSSATVAIIFCSCRVSNSSGSSDLDQAACDGMTRYARYEPALNAAGNPIQDTVSTTIVYRLN